MPVLGKLCKHANMMISQATILKTAPTDIDDCTALDCRLGNAPFITSAVAFHGSATGNVTLAFYTSMDGTNYDTEAFATDTLTCVQGTTVRTSTKIDGEPLYIKVIATNADTSYSATALLIEGTITRI